MNKINYKLVILFVAFIFIVVFLRPVQVSCGAPHTVCNTGLNPDGTYSSLQVTEPAGILFLENILRTDIQIEYTSEWISHTAPT